MKRRIATALALLAAITPTPVMAIAAIPPTVVGPPDIMINGLCRISPAQPGGAGSGPPVPFPALRLGAPVKRTKTSFTTGRGGGTSNAMAAAQRNTPILPREPVTVNPASPALPAIYAEDRAVPMFAAWAPYQRLPLVKSTRVAEPFGLVFAIATSPTRGRIAALTLSIARRPTAPSRVRLTIDGPADRGCQRQVIDVYAPAMSASTINRLSTPNTNGCRWFNLAQCPRAQWPRGRALFVSPLRDDTFEYRWIDYDLLAHWRFAQAKR